MSSYFLLFLLPIFLLISSCSKNLTVFNPPTGLSQTLFIHMPKNNFVFDNLAPLVHKELSKQYRRIGYALVNTPAHGYEMKISIISLIPQTKFASPDLLLFHSTIELTLECMLIDSDGKEQAKKTFSFYTLINKARNPILRNSFLTTEYQKLLQRSVYKIEHYFRPFFLK